MPPLFVYFGKEASHVSWESTKAWQLPTAPVNRRRAAQAGLDHLKQHGGELRSDSLQDKFTLLLFGCLVQNVKLIFRILFFSYVLKWGAGGEPTQFGMSGKAVGRVRWGVVGGGEGWLESDPFSKSLLLFPSCLCFKAGKLLAFEKYPFPICCVAAPVVITSPLPSALVERR